MLRWDHVAAINQVQLPSYYSKEAHPALIFEVNEAARQEGTLFGDVTHSLAGTAKSPTSRRIASCAYSHIVGNARGFEILAGPFPMLQYASGPRVWICSVEEVNWRRHAAT